MVDGFAERGWITFPYDPAVFDWLQFAGPAAISAMDTDAPSPMGYDCHGTWFVGVDALPNDTLGRVARSGPLTGSAVDFLRELHNGTLPDLHLGQVSGIFPGYPRPREHEDETGFAYRLKRDAAHVDGLLPVGPNRARMICEPHAYVLGLPVTTCNEFASPLVVWEGSHLIMQRAFRNALDPFPSHQWKHVDVTHAYQTARREVFATCKRVKVVANPGEAYVLHRHSLHGVAPWEAGAVAPPEGRVIIYFRPEFAAGVAEWVTRP